MHWLEEEEFRRDYGMNFEIKSGPGYNITGSPITGEIEATIHDSSSKEPVRQVATGVLFGGSLVIVATQFLAPEWAEIAAVIVSILSPVVMAIFTRKRVWSPASVRAVIEEALKAAEQTKKR